MKALILHGTGSNHNNNWFPWAKKELEQIGYEVWVPDLPQADHPNVKRYNEFLLESDWDFKDNLIIGHSSGAVEILGLLQALPEEVRIHTAILIGSFTEELTNDPEWKQLKGLFEEPFDFATIKQKAEQFISDDDPYCPIKEAEYLCKRVGGEFIKFTGMGHFSYHLDPKFVKFPELIEIIKEKVRP
jgi:predicted alpha/beta hydrolase family esterase